MSQSLNQSGPQRPNTATSPAIITGIVILIAGLGGFLLWAFTAPLDEGIVSHGTVIVESNRKTIQHLDGGIVSEIYVRDGDTVQANQPLFRLDRTETSAELGVIKSQYTSSRIVESRLLAERDRKTAISVPEDLQSVAQISEQIKLQQQLFDTRRRVLAGEISIMQQSIAGLEAQMVGVESLQQSKVEQIRLLNNELATLRALHEQGYVPHTRIFDLERALADVTGGRDNDLSRIAAAQKNISELRLRILQRQQDYQKEVETQLADIQRNVASLREQMQSAEAKLARTEIYSPSEGIVIGLKLHTIGGVIRPGEPLMDIVPKSATLVIEARVNTQDRDKIHPDLTADVRFVAFNQTTTPVVEGKVTLVSADSITDDRSGVPYYLAQVIVPLENLKKLGDQRIQPGMPVDVIIKTGERTFMNYLFKPFMNRLARALTEE